MSEEVSKTGVWIDSKTGKVVESVPEEGVQLVPPGGEVGPTVAAQIEALRKPAPVSATPVDLSVQEPAEPQRVSTVAEPEVKRSTPHRGHK